MLQVKSLKCTGCGAMSQIVSDEVLSACLSALEFHIESSKFTISQALRDVQRTYDLDPKTLTELAHRWWKKHKQNPKLRGKVLI